jgi:hypothetical protein
MKGFVHKNGCFFWLDQKESYNPGDISPGKFSQGPRHVGQGLAALLEAQSSTIKGIKIP